MTLPTREEISPTLGLDLDERVALDHFFGKTQSEASALFFEYSTYYEGDLRWMGSKAFVYYFPSLEPYILSEKSEGDPDIVNALMGTVKSRLEDDPLSIRDCQIPVLRILTFIRENFKKFDVNPEIYGDLSSELSDLIEKVQAVGSVDV